MKNVDTLCLTLIFFFFLHLQISGNQLPRDRGTQARSEVRLRDGKTTAELSGDFPRVCMNHRGKCKTKFCAYTDTRRSAGSRGRGTRFRQHVGRNKQINKLRKTPPAILPLESYLTAAFPLLCGILISTNTPLCARVRSI